MWIGSMKWNFIVAGIVSSFTFLFSFMNNLFLESLLRSLLAFLLFFLLVFALRFLVGRIVGEPLHSFADADRKGEHIDFTTPEESGGQEIANQQDVSTGFSAFTSADFPQLTRNDNQSIDPEEVARALRVFSNE
jgi:hypothetical protein